MRLLLTNDDGIDSPGLWALEKALARDHEVWVVAPASERSGTSHTISLKGPIGLKPMGDRRLACSGSPVDCVNLALNCDFIPRADLVISGINKGPNLGTDLIYSGTAGAARQAALMGVPGIATSLASLKGPFVYEAQAQWLALHALDLAQRWRDDHFINVNFPLEMTPEAPAQITSPSRRHYSDRIVSYVAPDGERFCFVEGFLMEGKDLKGTDWHAVNQGFVAVSPVALHPINAHGEAYQDWARRFEP